MARSYFVVQKPVRSPYSLTVSSVGRSEGQHRDDHLGRAGTSLITAAPVLKV